jgi:class 3 adenylate cyclase/DNA-binding CsgD family transcriptional regulator/tetratricopeptide (TPR) repeat protein
MGTTTTVPTLILPAGTVTFLFTAIENATRLQQQLGRERFGGLVTRHEELLRETFAEHGAVEVEREGDSLLAAFADACEAVAAATSIQRALAAAEWPLPVAVQVRIGLHTGEVGASEPDDVGSALQLGARVAAAAHGGQTLLSGTTAKLVEDELPADGRLLDLGERLLPGARQPERLFALELEGDGRGSGRTVTEHRRERAPVVLVGRGRECTMIDALLLGASAGESGALVIRGEPGIGKTALLTYAAERAVGMDVLTTASIEAEADLAFAGLYGLLRPVLGNMGRLPEVQANALAGALGLAPSIGSERFLVSAAALGLLAEAADRRPMLCLVDDAQWLDTPSADALVFAARRLRGEHVAILFGARVGDARTFEAPGVPELVLDGLGDEDARLLLSDRPDPLAPAVRERLLREAAGNPLALLELPGALSEEQRAGVATLPDTIPLTSRLKAAFAERIERLPEATQTALLVAALDDTGDASTILRAVAALRVTADALEPAEASGLVVETSGTIAFRHPLVRAAVSGAATLAQRQRTHAALAAALEGEEHADRRVWHQALATLTADENVAAALEAAGRRSQLRGGHSSAATAFERAATLSETESARSRRLGAASDAAWAAGQGERAGALIARSLALAEGPERAQLLYLSGVIQGRTGSLTEAVTTLQEGIAASNDASLTLTMLREACDFASYAGDYEKLTALCRHAAEIPPASEADHFIVAVARSLDAELSGDHLGAARLCAEAVERAERLDDPQCLMWAASAAGREGTWGDGLPHANRAVHLVRDQALMSILPYALQAQAYQLLGRSQFDLSYAAAEEGRQLALDIGHLWAAGWNVAHLAKIESLRGRGDRVRAHLDDLHAFVGRSEADLPSGHIARALGLLELSLGRPGEALDRLLVPLANVRYRSSPLVVFGLPDAVEAAARSDRLDEVTDHIDAYQAWVEQVPNRARLALFARCRGLAQDSRAELHFEQAVAFGDALPPFERARTELLFGEWLRRERRRVDARPHLRAALELLQPLGVPPWEERARSELRASGETVRKRHPSTLGQLTPQEQQIALLVADGLTNREIGAQLFLSPRTIDYHLRKVFAKLEIASRTELVRMVVAERGQTTD